MGKNIRLTEDQFKYILAESLNEYKLDPRREAFRQRAINKAQQRQNADTLTLPQDEERKPLEISVVRSKQPITNKPTVDVYIYNLVPSDVKKLITVLGGNKEKYNILGIGVPKSIDSYTAIVMKVLDTAIEDWRHTGLLETQKLLSVDGHYSKDELANFVGNVNNKIVSDAEVAKNISVNQANAAETWRIYLNNINDPKVIELLDVYRRIGFDKTYGHQLSIKNVALILAQDSNATFVMPENKWKEFNRYVLPNAQKFLVFAPKTEYTPVNKALMQHIINDMGWGDASYDELPLQAQFEVDYRYKVKTGDYIVNIEFNISDTAVIPGKEDLFTQQAGLSNNLTGDINFSARAEQAPMDTKENPEDTEKLDVCANFIIEMCQERGINIQVSDNEPSAAKFVKGLRAYFLSRATKDARILKATNKEYFADNATQFTIILTRLALNYIAKFAHSVNYTQREATEFLNMVSEVTFKMEQFYDNYIKNKGGENQTLVAEGVNDPELNKQQILKSFQMFCKDNGISIVRG